MAELQVDLRTTLPAALPEAGTALFLYGTCFHPERRVRRLEVIVDGDPQPVTAQRMPRFDLFSSLHPGLGTGEQQLPRTDPGSAVDPEIRSYRSGFWATVTLPAASAGSVVELGLRARLEGGETAERSLARFPVGLQPAAEAEPAGAAIAVCMSTHNPRIDLLEAQLASIREQTETDWVCVISDDCSRPEVYARIEGLVEGDARFRLFRSDRRRGIYRGFERALELAPPDAELIALADQDDRWYPDKLATLRAAIGDAQLAYSDQRLITPAGEVLAESYWTERSNNYEDLLSLLVANTVTGAASMLRAEAVRCALPFPETPGEQFHDQWLALVALSLGRIAYVDRPLYDYVQHGSAALGHAAANAGVTASPAPDLRERLRLGSLRRLLGDGRGAYFWAVARLDVLAATLLVRCGPRMARSKRRVLRRHRRAERRPIVGVPRLAVRSQRARGPRSETLGLERVLVQGMLWRWAMAARATGTERPAGWTYDASMPPLGGPDAGSAVAEPEAAHLRRITSPLELAVSEAEPERINLLIPTIDLKHLFGGYIAKYNLARRLAEEGHRVRIVAVDPTPLLPRDWRRQVESYSGLEGTFERVEVAFAREADRPLHVNPGDRFIATTWWTAHVANAALAQTRRERFLYLIQEYEPFTFEMGSHAALAIQSYSFPHVALFSTELLRDFFSARGLGAFAAGEEEGRNDSTSFQNAITPVTPPTADELAARETRRVLFYARAEQHARRNMFELGLIALGEAIESGAFEGDWEFFGVGSVSGRSRLALPRDRELSILPRMGQGEYGSLLPEHDVGLALMFTPHPSLVPLEMASAGLLTVTNTYETKTAARLEGLSRNLIAAEPTIEGVVEGLARAASRVEEHTARVAGATVGWSDDWDRSFDGAKLGEVRRLLERC